MKIPFTPWEIGRQNKPVARVPVTLPQKPITAEQVHRQLQRERARETRRTYAAAKSDRLTADWGVVTTSANAEVRSSAVNVRARNRQLERDNDYMRRMLRLVENNVVGHKGVRLQNKAKDFVGTDKNRNPIYRQDRQANSMIEAAWTAWCKPENCTVARNMSGVDLQKLVVRRFAPDGGLLIRIHRGFRNAFQYAVQPLEIDRLDFNHNVTERNGNQVIFGIELDSFNAVVAYHILTNHPGDWMMRRPDAKNYRERVDARDMLFVHGGFERAEQIFPMPLWTSIATRLFQLERYEEAVQVASRIAAAKGVYIKQTTPEGYSGPALPDGTPIEDVEPGMQTLLDPGQEPVMFDPKFPMNESTPYIKSQIRGASSGSNLSSHAVGNDLSDVNYSSIRSGNLEDQEEYKGLQTRLVDYLLNPLFTDWLPFAINSGQLALPLTKLAKFNAPAWRPRRWAWVDPEKDVNASIKSIAARLESREDVIEETGGDMEEIDAQFEADPVTKDLPIVPAYFANPPQPTAAEAAPKPKPEAP